MKNFIKIVIIFLILLLVIVNNISYAKTSDNETIEDQQEEFKIEDFIDESKEYSGDFFDGIDIGNLLNDAISGKVDNSTLINRIWNLIGSEVGTTIKSIVSILVIIIIHSILKSVSESLENESIGKLIYYVQYILIVTIIMSNFSDIVKLVQDTANNLVGFMNCLVPLLMALMMYTGSITVLVFTSLVIISKISDQVQVDKLANFLKSGIVWFLGIVLTIFVGVVSLEGTMSASVDGITAKATKAVVSSAVPVVGKILGDAVDTVLGSGVILKNAVGVVGVIIIIGICIMPIIKLAILTVCYKLLGAVTEVIADKKITSLIDQIGDVFKIFLGILSAISVMLIIGTALVLKMSNSAMMYR